MCKAYMQKVTEIPPSDVAADVPKAPPVSPAVFPCHRIEYEEPGTQPPNIIKAASASCKTLMGKNSGEQRYALMNVVSKFIAARHLQFWYAKWERRYWFCHNHMRVVAI